MKLLNIILLNLMLLPVAQAEPDEVLLSFIDNYSELTAFDTSCPVENYKEPEAEYKDHISNCSSEGNSCLLQCMNGSPNHCFGLAIHLQANNVDDKYPKRLFGMACEQGLITACTNFATSLMAKDPDNTDCYPETFKHTCSKSDAWGCTMYGMLLSRGLGVEKDTELALSVLKTGCIHGEEDEACQFAKTIEKKINKKWWMILP